MRTKEIPFRKHLKAKPILLGIVFGGIFLAGIVALIAFTLPISLPGIATAIAFAVGMTMGGITGAAFSYFSSRRQENAVIKAQIERGEREHLLTPATQRLFTQNPADEVIIRSAAEIKERLKDRSNIAKIKILLVDYQSTRQLSVLDYVRLPAWGRDEGYEYLPQLSTIVARSKLEHLVIANKLSDLALKIFLEGLISRRTIGMNSRRAPELFCHVKTISIHGETIPVFDNFCRENKELQRLSEMKAGIERNAELGDDIEADKQAYYQSFRNFYESLGDDPFSVFGRRSNYRDLYTEWTNWKWDLSYAFALKIELPHQAGYTPAASFAASIPVIVEKLTIMEGVDWDAEARNVNATDPIVRDNAERLIAAKKNNWRAVLGLTPNEKLTESRIEGAARRLYVPVHPDRNQSKAAKHQFFIIGEAKERLLAELARAKPSNHRNGY